ncbi:unnamed protein product [Dovyalis caffra]|uniref:CASP-like protein n=1 Tax=Dovyalis caffra TaxID=77055 RepID=A0AAV1RN35_9ROSI|nr:unnamed protein product [Dovyalis caffra]
MANPEGKFSQNQPLKTQKLFIGAQIFFRIVAIAASLVSSGLLITNKQAIDIGGLVLDARYSYSPEFKFLAYANIFVAVFSLLSILFLFLVVRQGSNPTHYFILFLLDLALMSVVIGGCAAATAIGFLGKYGNSHTGWMQICDNFGKFCNRATTSVTFSYLSLVQKIEKLQFELSEMEWDKKGYMIESALASSWLMMTNKQVIDIGGFVLDAKYSYSPEFKFLAYASIVVGVFSFLSIFFLVLVGRQGSNPAHYFTLFLLDLALLSLVIGGSAAATAIGLLGKHGNTHIGWMQICDQLGKFCDRAKTCLTLSYLTMICLLVLTITSANKSRQIQV